jgi:hypothetical protein
MELNLCCFTGDALHVSRFLGQDMGVLKLDALTSVYAVLGHSLFFKMIKPDVPVVLLHPGPNRMPEVSNVETLQHSEGLV